MVKYLVRARAQVNDADKDGATALLYASRNSNMAIYKLLKTAPQCSPTGAAAKPLDVAQAISIFLL